MWKRSAGLGLTLLAAAMAVSVQAQDDAPTPSELAQSATETRQAVFKLLGFHMGPIGGMARGQVEFDAALAERNARRIAALAPMIPELFAARDTRDFDVDTEALPLIWDNMGDFQTKAAELEEAALTFAETAAGGDRAQVLGGLRAFGSTCGNCHDTYRVD